MALAICKLEELFHNSGIFDVTGGTLELNGTSGSSKYRWQACLRIAQLKILSSAILGKCCQLQQGDTLNITGTLSFGTSSAGLNTGDNITLKSSQTATANVGVLAATNTITGNVTVERYINTGLVGSQHHKTWQLLAIPTTGATIRASWMEGAASANDDPHPGYGTQITSNVAGAATWPSPGFDALSYRHP